MKSRLEIFLIYMFAFGAADGIAGALGLFFASDAVAEATGSPFQLEMGFANLTMGVLAVKAVTRRDGFREATALARPLLSALAPSSSTSSTSLSTATWHPEIP